MKPHPVLFSLLTLLLATVARGQTLITPTSATASTEHSAPYDIGNVIDGSGLPGGFGLADVHADYAGNNHWTASNSIAPANQFAIFNFSTGQSLTHFHLWNHRSNIIASSPNYYVTQFDLIFRDADTNVITSVNNLTAVGGTAAVQTYSFAQVDNVHSVIFDIDSNAGDPLTGIAEARFSLTPIPEPASYALLGGFGMLALACWRRRRIIPSRHSLLRD